MTGRNGDDNEALNEALRQSEQEDEGLTGDDRNVSGSATWRTLSHKMNDENQQNDRKGQAQSPREITPDDPDYDS